jgi:uncharacterized protein
LVTTGPYARARHPLYAIGVFLLAPGVALLLRSWLLLSVPVVMYAVIRVLLPHEESELLAVFGRKYQKYMKETGALFPRGRAAGSHGSTGSGHCAPASSEEQPTERSEDMVLLPEAVRTAWEDREGPVVLTTVSETGVPNSIYATCVSLFDPSTVVVADNYFDKTRANIQAGSKGCILFITKGGKAYQVKGSIQYHMDGEVFDDMKKWNPEQHPGHAAAALTVEKVYSGAEQLL